MMVIADVAGTRLALRRGKRFRARLIARTGSDART